MVATKSEVLKLIREKEERLKELGVSRLALFGSFLHDEIDSDSDADLIVEFQPGKKIS